MAEKPVKALAVDMAEMRSITADLRVQADAEIGSSVGEFNREIENGVFFGTFSPSGETQAARAALWTALHRHRDNAEWRLRLGQALATGLEKALANYTEADDLAAAALNLLEREVTVSVRRAEIAELRHLQGRGAHI